MDDRYPEPMGELFAADSYPSPVGGPASSPPQDETPWFALPPRPQGSGLLPDQQLNSMPVRRSRFQASAGTEDFDRMYRMAAGPEGGGDNKMQKLMMLMGG